MRDQALPGRTAIRAAVAVSVAVSVAAAAVPGTLVAVRLNRTGVVAGIVYLTLGLAWVVLASPTWIWHLPLGWFVVVALAGAFLPGLANQVSFARAYLAGPALLYAVAGWYGPLAVTVAVAGLTDLVDGTIARRLTQPTTLGGGLDPVVDGLFMAALCIGLSLGGAFPLWLALVVLARYLLPAAGGGLLIALGRRPELRHTLTGQISTVLILVLVGGVCLLRGLSQDSSGLVAAASVVIPLATVATFAHLAWVSRRAVVPAGAG